MYQILLWKSFSFSLPSHSLGNFPWLCYFTWVLPIVFFQILERSCSISARWHLNFQAFSLPSGLKSFIPPAYQIVLIFFFTLQMSVHSSELSGQFLGNNIVKSYKRDLDVSSFDVNLALPKLFCVVCFMFEPLCFH